MCVFGTRLGEFFSDYLLEFKDLVPGMVLLTESFTKILLSFKEVDDRCKALVSDIDIHCALALSDV